MRQLKIDVLSVLVETDKLEFGGLKARGILSPAHRRGGSTIAQGAAALAAEPWVWYKE